MLNRYSVRIPHGLSKIPVYRGCEVLQDQHLFLHIKIQHSMLDVHLFIFTWHLCHNLTKNFIHHLVDAIEYSTGTAEFPLGCKAVWNHNTIDIGGICGRQTPFRILNHETL